MAAAVFSSFEVTEFAFHPGSGAFIIFFPFRVLLNPTRFLQNGLMLTNGDSPTIFSSSTLAALVTSTARSTEFGFAWTVCGARRSDLHHHTSRTCDSVFLQVYVETAFGEHPLAR